MGALTIIIRSTNENTSKLLVNDLNKQINNKDSLVLIEDESNFEKKLYNSLIKAYDINNSFSVIIDADIIVRNNFIKKVKYLSSQLPNGISGFCIKIFDKFYNRPKFRGVHIYNTKLIPHFLSLFPISDKRDIITNDGKVLNAIERPEAYLKKNVEKKSL